ncbi:uncharacterized protein Z519_04428 [Cladophialophora bantiana CBS 173.52]|uniref:Uncharacterized protein n=1 Tax=Cladophialophora bantiana (strain ATCC 10958 / CBS 173.52 / CDC B-1940 / NIH 8579) TaxID=1442370 RepID=A0A0D2G758_CLAB1|nr:uncharacterized protein Z519_04428 [Cladophialophora bantiana CBS 173.52]KIW94452.1 hypothetical protein Z519_04428 [Cladophialophora bantiana CBS 173.52]
MRPLTYEEVRLGTQSQLGCGASLVGKNSLSAALRIPRLLLTPSQSPLPCPATGLGLSRVDFAPVPGLALAALPEWLKSQAQGLEPMFRKANRACKVGGDASLSDLGEWLPLSRPLLPPSTTTKRISARVSTDAQSPPVIVVSPMVDGRPPAVVSYTLKTLSQKIQLPEVVMLADAKVGKVIGSFESEPTPKPVGNASLKDDIHARRIKEGAPRAGCLQVLNQPDFTLRQLVEIPTEAINQDAALPGIGKQVPPHFKTSAKPPTYGIGSLHYATGRQIVSEPITPAKETSTLKDYSFRSLSLAPRVRKRQTE